MAQRPGLPTDRVKINGYAKLVAMVKAADPIFRRALLRKIQTFSPILAELCEQSLFTYSDIARLSDASLQDLLRCVPEHMWLKAWKLSKEPLRQRLLANMSEKKKNAFLEECKQAPRVLKSQVYRVQMQIAVRAQKNLLIGKYQFKGSELDLSWQELLRQRLSS